VGNVNRVKGHRYLLEALDAVNARGRELQAIVVGAVVEEPLYRALSAYVADRGLSGRVRFVGGSSQVDRYLAAATFFVLPSLSEAMPIALLEAMAAGCACITSRVGGVEEVVRHESNGLVVPPGDVPSLAAAMIALVDDPEKRRGFGLRASEAVVTAFSPAAIARKQAAVYDNVLRGVSRAASGSRT
jgi:glycosyltransferase involved in cell wall biosynthesis